MTVPAQDRFTFSSGNGVTTTFPYTFMIPGTVDDPQFLVYLIEIATGTRTDLTVDVDYSISGLGVEEGGVVTYPLSGAPLAATHRLVIESNMPYEQQTDVYNSGTLYLNAIEDQFDNTTRQVQQIQDRVNRTFSVGIGYEGNYELFTAPNRLIGWNSTGTALENKQSESESAAGAYAAQLAAEAAQAAAEAAAAALPPITANTMLVDNPAGTARETKTFAEVVDLLNLDIESVVAILIADKIDKASPFVDVASAATVDLGVASSPSVNITGTTTITSFGTSAPDGAEYLLKFAGALTVTHGSSLILPDGANVTTYANMMMVVRKEASNVWRVIWYSSRLDVSGGGANRVKFDASALGANITITLPNGNVNIPSGTLLTAAGLGFSKAYPGTPRLLAYATQFTWTHGLGGVPKFVVYQAQCVTAENGYSVGDIVPLITNGGSNGTNRAASLSANATTIKMSASNGAFMVGQKAASPPGSQVSLTAGKWNLIPIAFI